MHRRRFRRPAHIANSLHEVHLGKDGPDNLLRSIELKIAPARLRQSHGSESRAPESHSIDCGRHWIRIGVLLLTTESSQGSLKHYKHYSTSHKLAANWHSLRRENSAWQAVLFHFLPLQQTVCQQRQRQPRRMSRADFRTFPSFSTSQGSLGIAVARHQLV